MDLIAIRSGEIRHVVKVSVRKWWVHRCCHICFPKSCCDGKKAQLVLLVDGVCKLEELTVTLCDKLIKVVDTSATKTYNRNDPKSPISQAILDLIKEKRRLRALYHNTQDS